MEPETIEEIIHEPEFYIGQIFEVSYPPEAAVWCNMNNAYIEEIEPETEDDCVRFEICAVPEPAQPTEEDMRQLRAAAYGEEVDPITSHIQRLRDEEPESEEIAELLAERAAKVEEIKERFPYPIAPTKKGAKNG